MILKLAIEKDVEAGLIAQAHSHGLSLEAYAEQVLKRAAEPAREPPAKPIWEILADSMQDLPPEDIASIPTDGASQVDHYIYGHPKRNP